MKLVLIRNKVVYPPPFVWAIKFDGTYWTHGSIKIDEWLRENCKGKYANDIRRVVVFELHEDAMMFYLAFKQ